jgi:hypothetical protein
MPTRPMVDLSATVRHTVYVDTLCSVTDQILIRWCEANHLHQVGPLPQKDQRMSCQEVRVGRVHVLLPMMLRMLHSMVCFILHEHPHELILSHQQLLDADRCMRWRWRWVATWGMPTTTPAACGSLNDVKPGILSGSGSHHLS